MGKRSLLIALCPSVIFMLIFAWTTAIGGQRSGQDTVSTSDAIGKTTLEGSANLSHTLMQKIFQPPSSLKGVKTEVFTNNTIMGLKHSPVIIPEGHVAQIIPRAPAALDPSKGPALENRTIVVPQDYYVKMVPTHPLQPELAPSAGSDGETRRYHTGLEIAFSALILVFGFIIIYLITWTMKSREKGWGPVTYRLVVLVLVIVAAMFLTTAGYSKDQITPVMGLLSTIAGFLLGRKEGQTNSIEE